MRSYEVPAMGGCLVVEDTSDHRALFGADGHAVAYFAEPEEAVEKVAALLRRPDLRRDLARRAHAIVTTGGHTYADRLKSILQTVVTSHASQLTVRAPGLASRAAE